MAVEDTRLEMPLLIRTTVTARMGQLQSDQQSIIRSGSSAMLFDERLSKARETGPRVRSGHELIGIGAAFVAHRYGFAAPDQFRPATPESLPSAKSMFAGIAVARSVPAFHGLDSEAIADFDAAANDGLRQWRLDPAKKSAVARDH